MTAIEFNHQLTSLQPSLERFALKLTANEEDARDLTQETYVKAIINRDKYVDYANLKAWTFTIMKNTFINNYRKAVKQKTSVDTTENQFFLNLDKEDKVENPESNLSMKEINFAIDQLEDEFRQPFIMHVSGYKYKEIADELGMKLGTVKSRIFFTRKKLMVMLSSYKD